MSKTERTVICGRIPIKYTLERKPVKNINLRVRSDGSIYVSANAMVPASAADALVLENAERIIRAVRARAQSRSRNSHSYRDGERFYILGRALMLKVTEGVSEGVSADVSRIYLSVAKKKDTPARREKLIKAYIDKLCRSVFGEVLGRFAPLFSEYLSEPPRLRVRDMSSRWGSCIPAKQVITLNRRLIERPLPAVEYVVLHELCHFVCPNHSKAFYALVASHMPDYKERAAMLKQTLH